MITDWWKLHRQQIHASPISAFYGITPENVARIQPCCRIAGVGATFGRTSEPLDPDRKLRVIA